MSRVAQTVLTGGDGMEDTQILVPAVVISKGLGEGLMQTEVVAMLR